MERPVRTSTFLELGEDEGFIRIENATLRSMRLVCRTFAVSIRLPSSSCHSADRPWTIQMIALPLLFARVHLFSSKRAATLSSVLIVRSELRPMIRSLSSSGRAPRTSPTSFAKAQTAHLAPGIVKYPLPNLTAIELTKPSTKTEAQVTMLLINSPSLLHFSLETVDWVDGNVVEPEIPHDLNPSITASLLRLHSLRLLESNRDYHLVRAFLAAVNTSTPPLSLSHLELARTAGSDFWLQPDPLDWELLRPLLASSGPALQHLSFSSDKLCPLWVLDLAPSLQSLSLGTYFPEELELEGAASRPGITTISVSVMQAYHRFIDYRVPFPDLTAVRLINAQFGSKSDMQRAGFDVEPFGVPLDALAECLQESGLELVDMRGTRWETQWEDDERARGRGSCWDWGGRM